MEHEQKQGLPVIAFGSPDQFSEWMTAQPDGSPGLWLKIAKSQTGLETVTYAEAVEVALCHGWIDGQKDALDATYWLQRFTPRKPKGAWSKINREKAERLIAEGKMGPGGQREIDAARADGRWDRAYDGQRTATVPEDLKSELDARPAAAEFFATLKGANRYSILYRLQSARTPATRAKRLATFVEMLEKGEKIYP
jgi:uncharacterized protein YdeI (YjbR/CyaY-like superfamily)